MDFINKVTGGGGSSDKTAQNPETTSTQQQQQEEGSGGGFMGKLNSMAGGGAQGEKNEDGLDKAIDFVQEKFLGGGQQSNETAAEQAKDEAISDYVRGQYKKTTGSEFPIADKDKNYGT